MNQELTNKILPAAIQLCKAAVLCTVVASICIAIFDTFALPFLERAAVKMAWIMTLPSGNLLISLLMLVGAITLTTYFRHKAKSSVPSDGSIAADDDPAMHNPSKKEGA